MKTLRIYTLFIMLAFFPALSDACPLCQAGATKKTQKAYEETTAILALLPLIGAGSIFYWLHSKYKRNQ